jgi:aspartate carbamoyltransferase regulatory subunit
MRVDGIQNGIVIDHIKAGRGMEIYDLLELKDKDCSVALMINVVSSKMGRKDIIKIDSDIPVDYDVIGYVDPGATINTIKDGKLIGKTNLKLPKKLVNVIKCKNPRCITSTEQELDQIFRLTDEENKIYRCIYCETAAKSKQK